MTSTGKGLGEMMNIDFYAIEAIKQNQVRERLTAEKRARIREASLSTPQRHGLRARLALALDRMRIGGVERVESRMCPPAISTNVLNGD